MIDDYDKSPTCCGETMTRETFDFFTCRQCGTETHWDYREDYWHYDLSPRKLEQKGRRY